LYHWVYFDTSDLRRCFPRLFRTTRTAQDYVLRWRSAGHIRTARPGYQHQQQLHAVTRATAAFLAKQFGRAFPAAAAEVVSPFLIEHERETSHFQTDIHLAVQARPELSIPLYERRFGQRYGMTYRDGRGVHTVKPDLAFLLLRRRPSGRKTPLLHFCEIDRGRASMTAVRRKLVQYRRWYEADGQAQLERWYQPYGSHRPVYRLLVVTRHRDDAGDDARQLVRWYTHAVLAAPRLPMFITTAADLGAHRRGDDGRIWYPLHLFRQHWRDRLVEQVEGHSRLSLAYDAVAERLSQLRPRYELLPPAE
jgi:hypothetical protein